MAVERLKIRCYQCNQLLAVSPNRAGTVVACPKCKADLLIPRQETLSKGDGDGDDPGLAGNPSSSVKAPSSAAGSPSALSESSPFMAEIAAMIPPELAALRPEDLRVEAEFFETLTNEPPVAPAPRMDPFQFPPSFSSETLPATPETPASPNPGFAPRRLPRLPARSPPPLPCPCHESTWSSRRFSSIRRRSFHPPPRRGGSARLPCRRPSSSPGRSSSSPPSRCPSSPGS